MSALMLGTNDEVARLTRPERERRVELLIVESHALVDEAIERHVTNAGKTLAGTALLFSGGNDSTTLAHLMRDRATHAIHANTGIGIEETREYVRNTCMEWGIPLIEVMSPRLSDRYEVLVLERGFPGPGHHYKMYQRLKERALRAARKQIIGSNGRRERVIFLAGRRRDESARRVNIPDMEREGSVVWVSPLVSWTKLDMNTYRLINGNVPSNRVSDLIHMSGECLCGSFSKAGELDEISGWFPEVGEYIRGLEAQIADRDDIPENRKKWGWNADEQSMKEERSRRSGRLCSSCESRHEDQLDLMDLEGAL